VLLEVWNNKTHTFSGHCLNNWTGKKQMAIKVVSAYWTLIGLVWTVLALWYITLVYLLLLGSHYESTTTVTSPNFRSCSGHTRSLNVQARVSIYWGLNKQV